MPHHQHGAAALAAEMGLLLVAAAPVSPAARHRRRRAMYAFIPTTIRLQPSGCHSVASDKETSDAVRPLGGTMNGLFRLDVLTFVLLVLAGGLLLSLAR